VCLPGILLLSWAVSGFARQALDEPAIPPNFKLDQEAALRLRPQLLAHSTPADVRYPAALLVFDRLLQQAPRTSLAEPQWELRLVPDNQFNAYSSPDGTIYVDTSLAQLAGDSAGLWAAVLSHEIAHVLRRDWARRYLYERSLERGGAATVLLGDPGAPSATWTDSQKASEDLARLCRQIELEADRLGLTLMARAGYHPDFMPALHQRLRAHEPFLRSAALDFMHPCWEERDHELSRDYVAAAIEFERRWQDWHASPGGNPPLVVFAEPSKIKRTQARDWEIQVPLRCQNLVGAIEVVLRQSDSAKTGRIESAQLQADSFLELRQVTGCTSAPTLITFTLADPSGRGKSGAASAQVYILDARGTVLTRADVRGQ